MKAKRKYILLLISVVVLSACKPDPSFNIQAMQEENINFIIPEGWPAPVYDFENNTLTNAGFYLGRKLFYDPRLSRDNSTSCGSCHQAFAAFAHSEHDLSHGVDGLLGIRNSPPIFNLNWHTSFFWDGGVNHIESQPIAPIQNPVEMDETLPNVIAKISNDEKYRQMFKDAWGDETINSQRIFKSITQFMGAMVSANAKYDQYTRGDAVLTQEEQNGLTVFNNHCASCHKAPLFTDLSYRNNGLKPSIVNDSGRAHITREPHDLYKFKVPSLRNLKYTAPYMHDGRVKTLEQVLNHYATGIHQSPTLDPQLLNGIQLTMQQRSDLLAFLNTLNDESFIKDKRFHETQ
ncbi:MAG: c-type cytochrome [Taibaiella sp.]|nr:c-type cytochrome [Taibaiella sp.]